MTTTVKVIRPHPVTVNILRGLRGRPGADGTGGTGGAGNNLIIFNSSDPEDNPELNRYKDQDTFAAALAAMPRVPIIGTEQPEVFEVPLDLRDGGFRNMTPWLNRTDGGGMVGFAEGATLTNVGHILAYYRSFLYQLGSTPVIDATGPFETVLMGGSAMIGGADAPFTLFDGDVGEDQIITLWNGRLHKASHFNAEFGLVGEEPAVEAAHDHVDPDGYQPIIASFWSSEIGQDALRGDFAVVRSVDTSVASQAESNLLSFYTATAANLPIAPINGILTGIIETQAALEALADRAVKDGGTAGQIYAKLSDGDGAADWVDLDSLSRVGFVYSQINTIADPGPGKVRLNSHAVPAFPYQDVSVIAFDNLDSGGKDTTAIAHILGAGNRIYMQDPAVSTAFVKWTVTGPASMLAGYWTIPVELIESSEAEFADLTPITALFALGAGADVTQADLDAAVAGKLSNSSPKLAPDPTSLPDNDFIVTASGLYVARTPADVRAALGTGTPTSLNFLRGDGTWATPASASAQAVRVIAATRTTGTTPVSTPLVPVVAGTATLALIPGRHVLCPTVHSGQTLSTLSIRVTASALTGSQAVIITCYANQADDTPGALVWQQSITVGTSTGVLSATGLSLAMPNGPCWIGVLNVSGNAGNVTLYTASPTMAGTHIGLWAGTASPVKEVTAALAASADMSAYSLKAGGSTGSTSIGVEAGATFPVVGALA